MVVTPEDLRSTYRRRFLGTSAYRDLVWRALTSHFFNRWIAADSAVLDLGCGYGEFINNIRASEKYAMDLNPDSPSHLSSDVQFISQDCSSPWPLTDGTLHTVFTSNFFEHLPDKSALQATLEQAYRCLRPGGRLIAVGPNIKYLCGRYWDFFDHHVALTESSLAEACALQGFLLERVTPRFLPFTMVNGVEYPILFVKIYLSVPLAWRIWGRQFLVVASKPLRADEK
jgi:SAM-dependent methyltransferase